jgi:hypothetical protein
MKRIQLPGKQRRFYVFLCLVIQRLDEFRP